MTLLDQIKAARASGDPASIAKLIPYARFLGITLAHQGDELQATMIFASHLVGNASIPALHGGAIAGLLETTAVATVIERLDPLVLPRPVTLTFDYLRPGRAADLFAAAQVIRRGRRICTVHVVAWQGEREKPVATANATFLMG